MSSIGTVHDVTFTLALCLVTKCCTHSTTMPSYLPWQHVVTSVYVRKSTIQLFYKELSTFYYTTFLHHVHYVQK